MLQNVSPEASAIGGVLPAKVSFSLPGEQGGGLFRGQVTDSGLSGRFADGRAPWDLKRGKSYWQ